MERNKLQQRTEIVKIQHKNDENFAEIVRKVKSFLRGCGAPSRSTIVKLMQKFELFGQVNDVINRFHRIHSTLFFGIRNFAIVMEPGKQNLDVKGPRTSKMVNIDVTDVSKTKPRCFRCRGSITSRCMLLNAD